MTMTLAPCNRLSSSTKQVSGVALGPLRSAPGELFLFLDGEEDGGRERRASDTECTDGNRGRGAALLLGGGGVGLEGEGTLSCRRLARAVGAREGVGGEHVGRARDEVHLGETVSN